MRRILYLALADARGHLMRAVILREQLAKHGVRVDVVTTSAEGKRFLAAFGCPAEVLSDHFRIVYDDAQNMRRARTEARVLAYLASPRRGRKDLRRLLAMAEGADLVVNDSMHPALFFFAKAARELRIVHVYGENIGAATDHHFDGALPAPLAKRFAAIVRRLRERSFARIVHAQDGPFGWDPRTGVHRVPAIAARPSRSREEVRADLGVAPDAPLAAVYLNPHFRDAAIASALERALAGFHVHAVCEGYADRAGWRAWDPRLCDAIAAADLFVSAPGMGAITQARAFDVPFLAITTEQPEQLRNLADFAGMRAARFVGVRAASPDLAGDLARAVSRLSSASPRPDPRIAIDRVHSAWTLLFLQLLDEARREPPPLERSA